MPEMDGPTMFTELRKRGIKAKVIFVSGYAEEAFSKGLPEGEEFGFLPKPFSLKQLDRDGETAHVLKRRDFSVGYFEYG
jgi:two-component system cell cycle sensor histidine kinase/response regulator CckA